MDLILQPPIWVHTQTGTMKYKVEFEHNVPVKAVLIKEPDKNSHITYFDEENEKTVIRALCVEVENEPNVIKQAQRIIEIIRF
jgi:hypothetical protein